MIFYINDISINNEISIVNKICSYNNINIILINTKSDVSKILNILPSNFDTFADITNNNNLLILYDTKNIKVIYRLIKDEYILFIIKKKLFILINQFNIKLINIINKIIKLVNNNSLIIENIILNINNNNLNQYLSKITKNIDIINHI
jgi:hypothetical protein